MRVSHFFALIAAACIAVAPKALAQPASAAPQPQEAKAKPQAAPGSDFVSEFAELNGKVDDMQLQIDGLKSRLDDIESDTQYHTLGAGLGMSFGQGGTTAVVDANLSWIRAYYYMSKGGGLALSFPIHIKRVTVRPIGMGVMFNQSNDPMSVPWMHRGVDLTVPVGIDVRIWKGLQVSLGVVWFLPNPVTVGEQADQILKAGQVSQADIQQQVAAGQIPTTIPGLGDVKGASDIVSKAYSDAFTHPSVQVLLRWMLP